VVGGPASQHRSPRGLAKRLARRELEIDDFRSELELQYMVEVLQIA
jgi:hypothetical protein